MWLRGRVVLVVSVVALLAAGLLVVLLRPRDNGPATPPASGSESPAAAPELVIKIDNAAAARPQTGLGDADVVYVEPVEGGLTRIAAVYSTKLPAVVGPVRSARETDVELLAQFGHPALAYSGAAPELGPMLHAAPLANASPAEAPGAYFRDNSRPAPHDLYVRPAQLPAGTEPRTVLRFGPVPAAGVPTADHHVQFQSAACDFHWARQEGRWQVAMDGSPLMSTDSGQMGAATVVVQKVAVSAGTVPGDVAGNPSPVARTVGSGDALVLRDGQSFQAKWSRPERTAATVYSDTNGQPLPLAAGPVWILLVPA